MDEHTAALDPKSADQVIALTDTIIRRNKLTTLMVHTPCSKRFARLCSGHLLMSLSARKIVPESTENDPAIHGFLAEPARKGKAPWSQNFRKHQIKVFWSE